LVFLALETLVYFALTVGVEYGLTFPMLASWAYSAGLDDEGAGIFEDEDQDVRAERERVATGQADSNVVKIAELRKVYQPTSERLWTIFPTACRPKTKKPKVAVQNLSFGIPRGECFGFLGNAPTSLAATSVAATL
jgi:hypothetical protein